jgi:hypothetical protein
MLWLVFLLVRQISLDDDRCFQAWGSGRHGNYGESAMLAFGKWVCEDDWPVDM